MVTWLPVCVIKQHSIEGYFLFVQFHQQKQGSQAILSFNTLTARLSKARLSTQQATQRYAASFSIVTLHNLVPTGRVMIYESTRSLQYLNLKHNLKEVMHGRTCCITIYCFCSIVIA